MLLFLLVIIYLIRSHINLSSLAPKTKLILNHSNLSQRYAYIFNLQKNLVVIYFLLPLH